MYDINSEQGKQIRASMVGGLLGVPEGDALQAIERLTKYCKGSAENTPRHIPVGIDRVIFNAPATIIIWSDGRKTVVKCQPDDEFDPLTGFLMAVCKRVFGNKGRYNDILREFVPGYGEENPD